jgi:hypothetical protein
VVNCPALLREATREPKVDLEHAAIATEAKCSS